MKPVINEQVAKAARAVICLLVLVVVQGCTTFQGSASGKSWSRIAGEEDREQQIEASPQDGWTVLP
jgi:hypothetical protein